MGVQGAPPRRRRPWVKYWQKTMNWASGDMGIGTQVLWGRRPIVLHFTFEAVGADDGRGGLQLVTVLVEYQVDPPIVSPGGFNVTSHALERLASRGRLLTAGEWVRELSGAVTSLFLLKSRPDLVRAIIDLGPGDRFHVPTTHGFARVVYENREFSVVTWLHKLDLTDDQRIEAALQQAEIAKGIQIAIDQRINATNRQMETSSATEAQR